jgi:AcrR family transcriptional regulator
LAQTQFSITETKIIEAYLQLSNEIGVANITLQKVATEANVAFGTVRYYFANNKNLDLTQAAVLYVFSEGVEYIERLIARDRTSNKFDGIKSYVRANVEWILKKRTHAVYLLHYYYLLTTKASSVVRNDQFLTAARVRIRSLIHESIGSGVYPPLEAIDALVLKIHALVMGIAVIGVIDMKKNSLQDQCEIAMSAITVLFEQHKK